MPLNFSFAFPLPNGLHARPASQLEATAGRFNSTISIRCDRNGNEADLHSVLSLIAADIREGDECVLTIEGADQASAFETLVYYLNHEFPHCDEPLPRVPENTTNPVLPNLLSALGLRDALSGQMVCGGLAIAPLTLMKGLVLAEGFSWPPARPVEEEQARLTAALRQARLDLDGQIKAATGQSAEILSAQANMLSDPSLASQLHVHVGRHGGTAGEAVLAVTATLAEKLMSGSAYLRERVADLNDIAACILTKLHGKEAIAQTPVLTARTILCAADLTPGQFLSLDPSHLAGIALENGGPTSHTAILARAAGVPLIIGMKGVLGLQPGAHAVLDARRGLLAVAPDKTVMAFYHRELDRLARLASAAAQTKDLRAVSADGVPLKLYANVATAADVRVAMLNGAQGIGLFRTELIFMNRAAAPDEDEQVSIYRKAIAHAGGRPLVFRTFDIGADKPISYLDLPTESNPFLGLRGVRLYDRLPEMIRTQLRALLRAAASGPIKIMVPMISSSGEMRNFRLLLEEVRTSLLAEGHPVPDDVPVGAMLEIPSAVFDLVEVARHADFFSIGSNDLAQYFLAADRDNASTAELGTWKHPAFLRLLQMAVSLAHASGRPIGLCGDLASRPEALPLLLALGFDSISLGAASIPELKLKLSRITRSAAAGRLQHALTCTDSGAVEEILSKPLQTDQEPKLLTTELLMRDSNASSKLEAINELVAMVDAAGRVGNPIALEEAVWAREAAFATNFGHGFAMPHCQTAHVIAPVIALIHLTEPVQWNETGEDPVTVAVLLAMPQGENRAHLQIFARLSRLIMREEFRDALKNAINPDEMLAILSDALQPAVGTAA